MNALHKRLSRVQAQIPGIETEPSPIALSLLARLASLTEQTSRLIADDENDELAMQEETPLAQDSVSA